MPGVSGDALARRAQVSGEVRLMTPVPLEMPALTPTESLRERWSYQLSRRPWLIPATLLGAGALVLVLRRR